MDFWKECTVNVTGAGLGWSRLRQEQLSPLLRGDINVHKDVNV